MSFCKSARFAMLNGHFWNVTKNVWNSHSFLLLPLGRPGGAPVCPSGAFISVTLINVNINNVPKNDGEMCEMQKYVKYRGGCFSCKMRGDGWRRSYSLAALRG